MVSTHACRARAVCHLARSRHRRLRRARSVGGPGGRRQPESATLRGCPGLYGGDRHQGDADLQSVGHTATGDRGRTAAGCIRERGYGQPQALAQEGLAAPVQTFATNQIVAVVRSGFGQTVSPSNLLSVLLDTSTRIGTSTPVADPLGDYTQQIFQKADAIMPGAAATLEAKRDELVANPSAPAVPAGANSLVYFLDTTQTVNIFISYVTSAVQARAIDPALQIVYLPRDLTVPAPFGLTVLSGASPDGQQFAQYILSPPGQQILASYGFIPSCRSWVRNPYRTAC